MQVKYLQVKEHLLELIRQGSDGDSLPSEAQLAEKFGVSRITTRKAMEQLEQEGLIIRKKGLGTFIQQSAPFADKIKRLLVVCDIGRQPAPAKYVQTILNGCYMGTASNDCIISLAPLSLGRQALVDLAEQLKVHGIIGITPYEYQNEILEELRIKGYPVLVVDRVLRNSHLSYISTDHLHAGMMATDFLLEQGHRRIGYATVIEGVDYTSQRAEGYEQAMRMGGGILSEDGYIHISREKSIDRQCEAVLDGLEKMLKNYHPTALVLDGHKHLKEILKWVNLYGLNIPNDLEFVVNDLDMIEDDIPQRTMLHELRQPFMEMGRQAVQWMNKYIENPGPRITRVLEPQLMVKTDKTDEQEVLLRMADEA